MKTAAIRRILPLIIGDTLAIGLVTLWGFASHNTLDTAGTRIFSTFFPLLGAWVLAASLVDLYDRQKALDLRQLWRPLWAMVFAAPLAAWLRGIWLGSPILPIFVLILGSAAAMGLILWRGIYALAISKLRKAHG